MSEEFNKAIRAKALEKSKDTLKQITPKMDALVI